MSTTVGHAPNLQALMQSNGLNIDGWDAPIYRVFSLRWFKDMITQRRNGLVRPSKWDDPFENFFLKCNVQTASGELGSLKPIHDGWYGQCWTMHRDSDAMWRIYSHDKGAIRVSTTIRQLFAAVCDTTDEYARLEYFIGVVEYKERAEIERFIKDISFMDLAYGGQADKFAHTLCIKRLEFSHEKEVRLLIQDLNHTHSDVLNVPFDYEAVLNDAVCDPRLEPSEFERVKNELVGLGCTLPITQSDLYKIEEMTIRLA
jgi:hypothetical protein